MKKTLLLLALSLLLFSCGKEKVEPIKSQPLTEKQSKQLLELIKLNPGVPIDVLIGFMDLSNTSDQNGFNDLSN